MQKLIRHLPALSWVVGTLLQPAPTKGASCPVDLLISLTAGSSVDDSVTLFSFPQPALLESTTVALGFDGGLGQPATVYLPGSASSRSRRSDSVERVDYSGLHLCRIRVDIAGGVGAYL